MGLEETKEPRPLRDVREQATLVACQPGIKRAVAHAFEGMQQSQSDHLPGPKVRPRVFGDDAHVLIDLKEQRDDKLHGWPYGFPHGKDVTLPAWRSRMTAASLKIELLVRIVPNLSISL